MHALHRHTAAFEQRVRAEMATRVEPLPFGTVVITADLPDVYDHNLVQVDAAAPADVVLAAVEEAAKRHGWDHRGVDVADAAIAAPLAAAFRSAGYATDDLVTMALLAAPQDHGSREHLAEAALVDVGDHRPLARALVAEQSSVTTERVLDQFDERERRLARHAGARAVVAPPTDPVSRCLLLTDGEIVEIDAVATLSRHRGHGWSNAVMRHAIATAGRRRVVLIADEGDWPAQWYARLGFRAVGRSVSFRRWPEDR
jgi:ribosomal protein S18 acetylase RimI-like enzyme